VPFACFVLDIALRRPMRSIAVRAAAKRKRNLRFLEDPVLVVVNKVLSVIGDNVHAFPIDFA
jgi:hypothetical protein